MGLGSCRNAITKSEGRTAPAGKHLVVALLPALLAQPDARLRLHHGIEGVAFLLHQANYLQS